MPFVYFRGYCTEAPKSLHWCASNVHCEQRGRSCGVSGGLHSEGQKKFPLRECKSQETGVQQHSQHPSASGHWQGLDSFEPFNASVSLFRHSVQHLPLPIFYTRCAAHSTMSLYVDGPWSFQRWCICDGVSVYPGNPGLAAKWPRNCSAVVLLSAARPQAHHSHERF